MAWTGMNLLNTNLKNLEKNLTASLLKQTQHNLIHSQESLWKEYVDSNSSNSIYSNRISIYQFKPIYRLTFTASFFSGSQRVRGPSSLNQYKSVNLEYFLKYWLFLKFWIFRNLGRCSCVRHLYRLIKLIRTQKWINPLLRDNFFLLSNRWIPKTNFLNAVQKNPQ